MPKRQSSRPVGRPRKYPKSDSESTLTETVPCYLTNIDAQNIITLNAVVEKLVELLPQIIQRLSPDEPETETIPKPSTPLTPSISSSDTVSIKVETDPPEPEPEPEPAPPTPPVETLPVTAPVEEPTSLISNAPSITYSTSIGSLSWTTFLRVFRHLAATWKWSTNQACAHLMSALRGEAINSLESMPPQTENDFDALCDFLTRRFSAREQAIVLYAESLLRKRVQHPRESLIHFANDINRLAHRAYTDLEQADEIAVHTFAKGLYDKQTAAIVMTNEYQDVYGALKVAMKIDMTQTSEDWSSIDSKLA